MLVLGDQGWDVDSVHGGSAELGVERRIHFERGWVCDWLGNPKRGVLLWRERKS